MVGATEEEARGKFDQLSSFIEPGSALGIMSERFGVDVTNIPLDGEVPDLQSSETGPRSFLAVMCAKARREGLTFKDVHDLFAMSRGYLLVRGTAGSVAETMEEWVDEQACDGFMLVPPFFPDSFDDFVGLVVPELQRRGVFRRDYVGKTLRSHLGLAEPAHRSAAR